MTPNHTITFQRYNVTRNLQGRNSDDSDTIDSFLDNTAEAPFSLLL